MDQDYRGANQGSEDASEAREHVRNVEENRDALKAQAQRTEATAPVDVRSRPVEGLSGPGQGGTASEDASGARGHVRSAEENRDALEAQNRRVESTAPEETRHPIDGNG